MTQMWLARISAALALVVYLSVGGAGSAAQVPAGRDADGRSTRYVNGWWFTGTQFVLGTRTVRQGVFAGDDSGASSVDLRGAHVLPPFADAHTHNLQAERLATLVQRGVLYLGVPNNLPREAATARATNGRVDVAVANGGFTSTRGHPTQIAARNIASGRWRSEDGDGGFYFAVDTEDHVGDRVRQWLATGADFAKIYLLGAREHSSRRNDPGYDGWRGVSADVARRLVAELHAADRRVFAHVETADDYALAVDLGVDVIAHVPGMRPEGPITLGRGIGFIFGLTGDLDRFAIASAAAAGAARRGICTVTTLEDVADQMPGLGKRRYRTLHRRNLEVLVGAGACVAIGTDAWDKLPDAEVRYLDSLHVTSRAALLKAWTTDTPAALFPGRRIGRLDAGYEASFVVLDQDPLTSLDAIERPRSVVRRGVVVAGQP